jgi:hypothetical protein
LIDIKRARVVQDWMPQNRRSGNEVHQPARVASPGLIC